LSLALGRHFYLKEELQQTERWGVVVALLGTVGIGVTATPGPDAMPQLLPAVALLLLFGAAFSAMERLLRRTEERLASEPPRRNSMQVPRLQAMAEAQGLGEVMADLAVSCTEIDRARDQTNPLSRIELIAGVQAGMLFGLSAASARVGMLLAELLQLTLLAPLGIACSCCLSSLGIFCQNRGMKAGRAVVVCTHAALATIVSGIVVGLLALNESPPDAQLPGWCASQALILCGVALLMRKAHAGPKYNKDIKEVV
jgi:drug/metabolite transporter (DMT)-like permease